MRVLITILIFITYSLSISAQYYIDVATTQAQTTLQGSARFVGTGGAIGSVGGDISTLSTNPAGLGMFSRSEIQISPTLSINDVNSDYIYFDNNRQETRSQTSKLKFTLGNIGAVIANRRPEKNSLVASNVTIAVNRTHDFNRTVAFTSQNGIYSYGDYLAANLNYVYQQYPNALNSSDLYYDYPREAMAYQRGLLYLDNGEIVSPVTGDVIQRGSRKISGGITEFSVAWSGNIKDKFYIGAALGIPFYNYTTETIFSEDDVDGSNGSVPFYGRFQTYTMREVNEYSGTGVNLKLGGLLKLGEVVKVSAYMHTPTYIELDNVYDINMFVDYDQSSTNSDEAPVTLDQKFSYITPFKVGTGVSFLSKRFGFISLEYEANFAKSTKFDFGTGFESFSDEENSLLKESLKTVHNLRLGGELVLKRFRIRSGVNLRSSPYVKDIVVEKGDLAAMTFSFGAGYRGDAFSFDLAYMNQSFKDYGTFYNNYSDNNKEFGISSINNKHNFVATFNYRFN